MEALPFGKFITMLNRPNSGKVEDDRNFGIN
jgi:hypothetical protein